MINKEDILSLEFLKKTEFTGSHQGMRYRLEKFTSKTVGEDGEEKSHTGLRCTVWPEPFNFHTTPEEQKKSAEFTFDNDGVCDAVAWMNDRLFEDKDFYEKAPEKWDMYKLT